MSEEIKESILSAIEDAKGIDPKAFYVKNIVGYADWVIIAIGTSTRHVKTIADKVEVKLKEEGIRAIGVEGLNDSEWVLLDFGDAVLHVMTAEAHEFYHLEKLFI